MKSYSYGNYIKDVIM